MKILLFSMSRSPIVFLVIIAFTITLTSCEPRQEHSGGITQKDIEAMKENHIIPLKNAVKMYKKYTKERVKILKDTLKKKYGNDFSDTRTVWFDINTIKAYLKYLEDNASEAEGLQFYFSVDLDDKGKQSNHQTFFIAPTLKNIIDGDTIQSGYTVDKGKRVFLYEAFKEYLERSEANIQKASFFNIMQGEGGLLLNRGDGTPPGNNN